MTNETEHDDAAEFVRQAEEGQTGKSQEDKDRAERRRKTRAENPATPDDDDDDDAPTPGTVCQYSLYGAGYKPTTGTIQSLKAGVYDIQVDNHGPYATPAMAPTGLLLELPEMRSDAVLKLVDQFWESEKDYKDGNEFVVGGAAYKAGIMIYGPPGSGKSCTIKLLSKKLVERGGTVFFASCNPFHANNFLGDFSRIEKNRKCIVIMEDIDSLIEAYGESGYLEMLDSAKSIENVLFIATTNYPDRMDPRIFNRPGRFSHVVRIGMPTPVARAAFLRAILKNDRDVPEIVEKTDGFSIDHLSALVNAVYREKKVLHKEIERLRTLFKVPKAEERGPMGLSS